MALRPVTPRGLLQRALEEGAQLPDDPSGYGDPMAPAADGAARDPYPGLTAAARPSEGPLQALQGVAENPQTSGAKARRLYHLWFKRTQGTISDAEEAELAELEKWAPSYFGWNPASATGGEEDTGTGEEEDSGTGTDTGTGTGTGRPVDDTGGSGDSGGGGEGVDYGEDVDYGGGYADGNYSGGSVDPGGADHLGAGGLMDAIDSATGGALSDAHDEGVDEVGGLAATGPGGAGWDTTGAGTLTGSGPGGGSAAGSLDGGDMASGPGSVDAAGGFGVGDDPSGGGWDSTGGFDAGDSGGGASGGDQSGDAGDAAGGFDAGDDQGGGWDSSGGFDDGDGGDGDGDGGDGGKAICTALHSMGMLSNESFAHARRMVHMKSPLAMIGYWANVGSYLRRLAAAEPEFVALTMRRQAAIERNQRRRMGEKTPFDLYGWAWETRWQAASLARGVWEVLTDRRARRRLRALRRAGART